jgi:sugar phosphate isomerase/epimerase
MNQPSRREFLCIGAASLAAISISGTTAASADSAPAAKGASQMRLGLVTYNWGRNWDLPTVIKNCESTGFEGVELRSTHKHGVEITLNKQQREEVAKRFADTPVVLAGLGSACEYHSPDAAVLKKNIDATKAFVTLCHDVGGEGVKVRPNGLPDGVPVERTLEQIGKALNEVGRFAEGFGVEIRLEVHGRGTAHVPHIKTIMDVADQENVVVCWNCNPQDLDGEGLEHNFDLVKARIGTIHIHDLRNANYPWPELFGLLKQADFAGWTLLEEGKEPADIMTAMHENRRIWEKLVAT